MRFVSAADVPAEVLERERAIEMEKEDLKSKPEAIRWVFLFWHLPTGVAREGSPVDGWVGAIRWVGGLFLCGQVGLHGQGAGRPGAGLGCRAGCL